MLRVMITTHRVIGCSGILGVIEGLVRYFDGFCEVAMLSYCC